MNKSFAFLALCAAILSVSCSKGIAVQDGNDGVSTFTCVIASDPDSRVNISDEGKNTWEPGDQILIHGDYTRPGYGYPIVTLSESDISADGRTATFSVSGVTPSTHSATKGYKSTIYAGYPASAVKTGEHCYYYTNFQDTNHPLMAAFNVGNTLYFYNLCGVISFKVSGDFDSYEFQGNNLETVGYSYFRSYLVQKSDGSYRLDYNYTSDSGTRGPLTMISGPVTADGSTVNYIGLPAGACFPRGFTFKFYKGGNLVKVAKTINYVDIARNKLLPLGDITARLVNPGDEPETPDPEAERLARLGRTPIVAVYFTEYTKEKEFPSLEEVRYFTHINIGHARFVNKTTGDGGLVVKDPGPSYLRRLAAYKQDYPELKLLLMIGGWGKNANGFSEMARDPDKRQLFCDECVRLCDEYNLDGIDLDWEYPTYAAEGNGASPDDTKNFTTLVKEMRAALGPDRLISYAASDSGGYIDNKGVLEWVDYINVMTYSMGDPPYHNSPLYRSSLTRRRSGEESIEIFHNQGVPYDRMNYGIGFYGHGDDDIYPSSVPYYLAREALEKGLVNGKEVAGYNIRHWDDVGKNCYLGDAAGTMYASYEDVESIGYRIAFAKGKGMLGVFAWEYREDDSEGTLRHALYNGMYDGN